MNKQMSNTLVQGDQTDVVLIGKDGVAVETICSTEVAEMVEKEHKNLLQDIRGYEQQIALAVTAGELKTQPTEYFIKSTYFSNQNKELPCYQITKKGCEFIASKLNGYKGTVFSTKYIDRFHQMQDYIVEKKNEFEGLSTEMQALLMLDKRSVEQDKRLTKLENTMTIDYGQQEDLRLQVAKRVIHLTGGTDMQAYKNFKVRDKVFREIYRHLKHGFNVNSYRNIAVKDYQRALEEVKNYVVSEELSLMIKGANAQMRLEP